MNHLKDPSFRLVHWLNKIPYPRKTNQESINLEGKCSLEFSSVMYGDILVVDLEELEEVGTHRKSMRKDSLNAKEVTLPQSGENYKFPVADGTVKERDQALRTSTLTRNRHVRGESHRDFLGESGGAPPLQHFQDSLRYAGGARDDFWSISGDFINRHHVEPRVKLYTPRAASFPFSLNYIEVTRDTHTTFDVLQGSRIDDYWNIDGSRDVSASWTDFTQFTWLKETPPEGYMWPGQRLTKRQATSRADHLWPEIWRSMSRNPKIEGKAKLGK